MYTTTIPTTKAVTVPLKVGTVVYYGTGKGNGYVVLGYNGGAQFTVWSPYTQKATLYTWPIDFADVHHYDNEGETTVWVDNKITIEHRYAVGDRLIRRATGKERTVEAIRMDGDTPSYLFQDTYGLLRHLLDVKYVDLHYDLKTPPQPETPMELRHRVVDGLSEETLRVIVLDLAACMQNTADPTDDYNLLYGKDGNLEPVMWDSTTPLRHGLGLD